MLKLNLQYFGHLIWRNDSLEKKKTRCWERLKEGGEGDDRGLEGWMASPTQWTWVWVRSGEKIGSEYSLEDLMLKLKLQYFDHPMQRADSLEKTLMLGKIEDKRRKGQQRIRWLDSITDSVDLILSKHWEKSLPSCSPWGCKKLDRLSDWTTSTTIQDEIFKQCNNLFPKPPPALFSDTMLNQTHLTWWVKLH